MGKKLSSTGAGAVRTILKSKQDFHFDLREETNENGKTGYLFDVYYENATGTLNMLVNDGTVEMAALNLSLGKVITLNNDANLKKLCRYVLENM